MKRRKMVSITLVSVLIFLVAGTVDAYTMYYDAPYDDGDCGTGLGGSVNDRPGNGECELYMYALGLGASCWVWIGSDYTFASSHDVSMDADLSFTGYIATSWPWGYGRIHIILECRKYSDESLVWDALVFDESYYYPSGDSWSDEDLTLDLSDFPKETPSGHFYFCVFIGFEGANGGLLQYSSGSSTRAVLEVNEIAMTYT